jgi:tetratricopeptide (TPR) repeat protein
MLQSRVWSSDKVAERVAKDFVPLYLDGDKNQEEKRMFPVNAYPTIILAEADGTILVTQRGHGGMMTPERWITWIDMQLEGVDETPRLLKEAKESNDPDKIIEVAQRLVILGRHQEAADLYARAEKLLEDRAFELRIERARLLLRRNEYTSDLVELMESLIPVLFERKDERTHSLVYAYANLIARLAPADKRDPAAARNLMLRLIETFPEHEQVRGCRNFAAMYAHLGGDDETALAEMRAMIAEDEENDVDDAYTARARRFVQTLEAGERFR